MNKNSKIYVAGHKGLVGSSIVRLLKKEGYKNLILKTRNELDLLDNKSVANFFKKETPEYVFLAAAKVGGIVANNTHPADFIYQNLQIQNNIIHNAYLNDTKKLLFLGSSCIYPRKSPQPIREEYLLTGSLEPTNKAYAVAKIAGMVMCESYDKQYGTNFISVMPTNLYGPNDNFDLKNSHVMPALIRKFHEAKVNNDDKVIVWGNGSSMREFLHVDDLANACIYLMENHDSDSKSSGKFFNIGTGEDISIKKLAEKIKNVVGFEGKIEWDTSKPNGTPRKLLDVSKLHRTGWKHEINLDEGLKDTYKWYKINQKK